MIHPAFQSYLPQMVQILKNHNIKNAYLFGSVLTDKFKEDSDIDLLVNFEEGLEPLERGSIAWNLQFALEDELHRDFDILSESCLKNPYFIKEVNDTKMKIYGK